MPTDSLTTRHHLATAPCRKCGASCHRTSVEFRGIEIAGGFLCESCLDRAHAEHAVLRGQFEALLAAGVDRAEANRIMIARIEGKAATA